MIAHKDARPVALEIGEIGVEASGIVDLRDAKALETAGIDLADAVTPGERSPLPKERPRRGRCTTVSSRSAQRN
ncbi:hypothetical protein ACNPNP_11060 [Microbacterium sp. AGC85]